MPPTTGLNVIALISGGKDSLYSILHCFRNGHNVVALANLHPATSAQHATADEEEDIDSFMYQTIGHSVIPLYESALGIPLYRAPISGGAVDTARVYRDQAEDQMAEAGDGDEAADETESLIPLLRTVMRAHPEANAVSAGAILSTYQRTRIENVAGRLGLVPLAWLWMYPVLPAPEERRGLVAEAEAGLLEDMAAAGCEARIIKVASGGLDEGFLWGDVSGRDGDCRRRIARGMRRFVVPGEGDVRGAVLGEGGEYESLAVGGPGFLWRGRIEIAEREVCSGEGGVGFVRLRGARVVERDGEDGIGVGDVRRPVLLDGVFEGVLEGLDGEDEGEVVGEVKRDWGCPAVSQSTDGAAWVVSNITAPEAGPGAAEQMRAIALKVQEILKSSIASTSRSTADIVFTTVLLRSMADFPLMNDIYVSLFKKPNPPARATVACGDSLPDGVKVMVSMVVDLGAREARNGLHVQSRSYWAPANIGPYSQAMSIPLQGSERLVYIAGQIPLEPASMELVESYALRAVLSLQHLWRIGAAMQVDWWLGAVAFLTGENVNKKAEMAWRLWERMHEQPDEEDDEEPAFDAWDIKYGRQVQEQTGTGTPSLPKFSVVHSDVQVPAFLAVQVDELPRGSDIEWQGLGCHCDSVKMATDEIDHGRKVSVTTDEDLYYTGIEIDMGPGLETSLKRVLEIFSDQPVAHSVLYSAQSVSQDLWSGQIVPCKSVWGRKGRQLAAGVIIQKAK